MGSLSERIKDNLAGVKTTPGGNRWFRAAIPALLVLLVINIVLGVWWSQERDTFQVRKGSSANVGETTVQTLIQVAETLIKKPGGYLSNDMTPPSIFLDNIPAWEFGVVVQVRDMSRALRQDISRSQSQSIEDASLARAEPAFNTDHQSFLFPAYEDKLKEGIKHLRNYQERLADADVHNAQFYARADNLNNFLTNSSTRLGSLSQRLSASVADVRVNTDLAGDSAAVQSTRTQDNIHVKTSFFELDDVFYEARGSCWALLHLLKAIEVDFHDVLQKKNALASLQQIIRELEATQRPVWSPMILNGSGFGLWANHSLVMANYISRANAGLIDLRRLLQEG